MRTETTALHPGYEADSPVRSVAVPIFQTVAYEFDSAEHAAALFNLEAEGFRYSRISNPTTAVLERRVAALEGGVGAVCLGSGQAALHNAILSIADVGRNIVVVPQLYGTTHTLFSHVLPRMGITARFAVSDGPSDLARLIDADTMGVFCESVGNPAGNVCDIEALARMAHEHGLATTHGQMTAPEQRRAGVTPEMIRLSVGIEHVDDILADIDQALTAAQIGQAALVPAFDC